MRELLCLPYSPWSERARWALDHHRVPYRLTEYKPMLGEAPLRLRLRRFSGKVTVPVLFEDGRAIDDGLAIARHAEAIGEGTPLFPAELDAEILAWDARAEAACSVGRVRTSRRVGADPDAQREAVEPIAPGKLAAVARPMALMGVRYFLAKYGDLAPSEAPLEQALEAARAALAKNGEYLLGRFTFADIAMAAAMQNVEPVADEYIHLGEATRRCWRNEPLAARYPELVAWRDRIYARHRRSES